MKVFIPKNISKGMFNMGINMGFTTISMIQLILLATGLAISLITRNTLVKGGTGKGTAGVIAIPFLLIFIFIAFFKYSELTLLPFIAKMVRSYFLDTTKKYQINWNKPDPKAIALSRSRHAKHDIIIKQKDLLLDPIELKKLQAISDQ